MLTDGLTYEQHTVGATYRTGGRTICRHRSNR